MSCGCNKNELKDFRAVYLEDVPIDANVSLPEYLLAERVVTDPLSGDNLHTITRLPIGRVLPNGFQDNIFALVANNEALEVPENQVRAGYIQVTGGGQAVQYAGGVNDPRFLILSVKEGQAYCQSTGVVNLLSGHDYVVGADYYASSDGSGEPTTDSESGQHLFYVLSRTQLLVDIKE